MRKLTSNEIEEILWQRPGGHYFVRDYIHNQVQTKLMGGLDHSIVLDGEEVRLDGIEGSYILLQLLGHIFYKE